MWSVRIAALFAALLLAACNFHLRGDPVVGIKSLNVTSVGGSTVAAEIRRQLSSGPTRVVQSPKDAEAVLKVLQETRDKQVYTITGTGRVFEFELRLNVRYEMTVPGRDQPLLEPNDLQARRIVTYSASAPTAKEAEEELLYKDMQAELATRILRQVAIARRDM